MVDVDVDVDVRTSMSQPAGRWTDQDACLA